MTAISGTRRAMKEMADGTIRVQVDIDPTCRAQFLSMFPNIDMPVALAPLRADFEQAAPRPVIGQRKGGELAKFAGRVCAEPDFWPIAGNAQSPEQAAEWIRKTCGITSRADLDHDQRAAAIFHKEVRQPWAEMHGVSA